MYSESGRKFNRTKTGCNLFPGLRDKGATHGVRHGKTDVQREHHMAWNAWKGCCKKVDSQGEQFTGIHDRFLRDPVYRESQLAIGWSEPKCKEWDELAIEDKYIQTPSRGKKKIQRILVSYSEQRRQKWAFEASI